MMTDPSHDPPTFKLRGVRPYLSTKGDAMILVARLEEETRNLRLFSNQFPLTISIASDLLHEVLECLAMRESSRKKETTTKQFLPMKSEAKENDVMVEMEEDKTKWLSDNSLCIGARNCEAFDKEKCVEAGNPSGGLIDKGGGTCFVPGRMQEEGMLKSVSVQLPMLPYFLHDLPPVSSNFNNSQALHESIQESSEGHRPFRMYPSGRIGPLSSANLQQNMLDQQHQQQTPRKTRRCWSRELHRKFEKALEELGGPEVATPKQIREVMKVDGLTNDEVKSHLQKYRMHAKKSSSPPAVHLDLHLKSSPVSSPDCPLEFSRFAHCQGQSESYGSELDMHRCIGEYSG